MENPIKDSPLQLLESKLLNDKGIALYVKRDDLIHEHVQGNKWRKLKYNLYNARLAKQNTLLTFGGPYSNHIYATAAAARLFHFKAIGIIRGEEPAVKSATLEFADKQGMELYYMDRAMYAQKDDPDNIESLKVQIGDFYHIAEGGTNMHALDGVSEIIEEIDMEYDYICTACGTGGTIAGLVAGLQGNRQVLGFSALKGDDKLTGRVNQLVAEFTGRELPNFSINFDYHFGGYAKINSELAEFIRGFKSEFGIRLDPVYTGKMFYGLFDLIGKDYFKPGTRIVALHTGGMQGLCGYPQLADI